MRENGGRKLTNGNGSGVAAGVGGMKEAGVGGEISGGVVGGLSTKFTQGSVVKNTGTGVIEGERQVGKSEMLGNEERRSQGMELGRERGVVLQEEMGSNNYGEVNEVGREGTRWQVGERMMGWGMEEANQGAEGVSQGVGMMSQEMGVQVGVGLNRVDAEIGVGLSGPGEVSAEMVMSRSGGLEKEGMKIIKERVIEQRKREDNPRALLADVMRMREEFLRRK